MRGKRWSGYLSWRRRRRHIHRRDVLDRLTDAVHAEQPVQILVTGDLVHIGLPEEIEAAAGWLEALGPPQQIMLVPGNHDVYARDSWPSVARAWQPYLGARDDGAFPLIRHLGSAAGRISLIGLSSAVPSPLFMAYGRLGEAQRTRLDGELAQARGFRCVLVHHPPLPATTTWRKGLLDAPDLARVLSHRGAELVLHGHVHHNVSATAPGGARVFGTASASSAGREVAAYRSFDVTPTEHGWHVDMRLMTLEPDGFRVAARETWQTLRQTASAASAAR